MNGLDCENFIPKHTEFTCYNEFVQNRLMGPLINGEFRNFESCDRKPPPLYHPYWECHRDTHSMMIQQFVNPLFCRIVSIIDTNKSKILMFSHPFIVAFS